MTHTPVGRRVSSDRVELSVIVPTHDRRASVMRLLERLRAQASTAHGIGAERFEAIVVADGCSDDTVEALGRSIDEGAWPFAVTVIEQSPARGAGIARNAGAACARGALLIFVDDDIEPFPTMLAAHAEAHAAVPNGESLVLVGAPVPVRPTPATLHDIAAWGWWEQQFENMSAPGHRFTYDEIFTGILSMPASLFHAVGGFDESLGDCHEDSELGLRLFRAGARGDFSRAAGGVHHEMRDMRRLLPRKFAEGRADVRIAQRWPELSGYLRISWRRPPWHTLAGLVRLNAFHAPWAARLLTRASLRVLALLSRLRMRNQWRVLHGGTLVQSYWLGVAAEVGSEESLTSRIAASGAGWARWSDATRWLSINLATGIESAERLLDLNRPDAIQVRLDELPVGTIEPLPTAERLHGGHLRRLLATTLEHQLRTALALREARAVVSTPLGEASKLDEDAAIAEPARETETLLSVIVPAWNAAGTLRVALDSLLAQTMPRWEAIVVDDGSTDGTAQIVSEYAARDERFRLVQQVNGGLSAARNAGIRLATSPWLHFLDADDWMAPTAFERMVSVLAADPTLDAVHCGWARVAEDGRTIAESRCWQVGDLFAAFAVRCAIAVHACLVRRSLVVEIEGFDARFRITQDWVLWQRIARRGARWGRVSDTLAYYAFRPESLSSDPLPLLREGLRCIALGHGVDPAVARAVHAAGRPAHEMAGAQLHYACWIAGMLMGRDDDAVALLAYVPPTSNPPAPMWIAESLVRSVPHSLGVVPDEWPARWPSLLPRIEPFLAAVERHVGMAGYARGVRVAMERAVGAYATAAPMTLGLYHVDVCECTESIVDRAAPAGCERFALHVAVCGERLGVVELPVTDGWVRATAIRDAITATLAWPLLGRFFETTHYRACTFRDDGESSSAWCDGARIAKGLPKDVEARRLALHDAVGWDHFLRDLWEGAPDDAVPSHAEAPPSPVAVEGWTIFEASAPRRDLQLTNAVADVLVQVGGVAVAALRLEDEGGAIAAHELPQRVGDAIGFELCRAAVREALVGQPWGGLTSLRAGLQRAASERRIADRAGIIDPADAAQDADVRDSIPTLAPGWREEVEQRAGSARPVSVIARRDRRFIGGSGDRTYSIGAAERDLALQLERGDGTPVIELGDDSPTVTAPASGTAHGALYLPSLRWRKVGTPVGVRAIAAGGRGFDERIADDFDVESAVTAPPAPTADRLPILMYHRVSNSGPAHRARWRVTPNAFEEQLAALADGGYRSIRLIDWQRAMDQGRPLPERPILITFDDGYVDFAEHAWPLLTRYGFGALAFIVTGCVGRHNAWDTDAASESLMDWETIRQLRDEGVDFGAHSVVHRRFTVLSPAEAYHEAAGSRQRLEDELQLPVDTFAYPYGAEDPVTRHVVGSAGFQFGLSVRSGSAGRNAPWLALPRIEVTGEDDVPNLLAKLDE